MEAWTVYVFDFMILVIGAFLFLFFLRWRYARAVEGGAVVAEIWQPNGFPRRHLVKPGDDGKTAEVEGCTYRLHEKKRRWTQYPASPFLGIKWLQATVRLESWDQDNPEPVQPFYGKFVDKDKKPVDPETPGAVFTSSQLMITASEITAMKREIQATSVAMAVQESEARQKQLESTIRNQPNKTIVYIGLVIIIVGIIASIFVNMNVMSGVDNLLAGWGLK